jgi:hypothetical protein
MKMVAIPKKSGKTRIICVPDADMKAMLRALCGGLEEKARKACPDSVLHGFTRERSPVTNALAHVGHRYTLCLDLADFFDHVTPEKLIGRLKRSEAEQVLIDPGDGRGRRALQGLPTSPAVANLAAADMDKAILRAIERAKLQIIYTRYADDLTFSFDDIDCRPWLLKALPQIVKRCGFALAARKTRFMPQSAGRRHITGVAVDNHGIHPTRAAKRRLRAARHQASLGRKGAPERARGLEQWCELREPRTKPPAPSPTQEQVSREISWRHIAAKLAEHWNLGRLPEIPHSAQPEVADGDYIITRDPAYILGSSTYTTGWTSCLRQPAGNYRHSVKTWLGLAGTSVAALLSVKTATHTGIERRVMRARCLLHQFRDGRLGYDRVYGDQESSRLLQEWLQARGAVKASSIHGVRVVGNVSRSRAGAPWCDTLRATKASWDGKAVWILKR